MMTHTLECRKNLNLPPLNASAQLIRMLCWQEDAWRSSGGLQVHHSRFQEYAAERISEWERQGKSVLPMTTFVSALERQRRTARVSG